MGHVRQETRLQIVGAPQVIGPLLELGVQRHDAAVGVLELAVDPLEFLLPAAQLVERPKQFLILLLDFFDAARRAVAARRRPARSSSAAVTQVRRVAGAAS